MIRKKPSFFRKELRAMKKRQPLLTNEIHKGMIFNSTIIDCEWLKERSFTPGEWAVDYSGLLSIYNALTHLKPKRILEFGLGQSSKMIHQYAKYNNAYALTIEHDESWIRFFNQGLKGTYTVNVQLQGIEEILYNNKRTLVYKPFEIKDPFELIFLDGPFGSKHYSRAQLIKMIPQVLASSFCIIIDDTHRKGEEETANEICRLLQKQGIRHACAKHWGTKAHTIICSEDYKFITTA